MSEKIKKIICCLTACAILTFSCVFCPRQKAEAFTLAPVVVTVAGLFALGLLAYGVSTSADSDFVQDNADSWAASNGFFSDPTQSIMNTICASLFLSSIKLYADLAYSSGACSSVIQGPSNIKPCFSYYSIPDTSSFTLSLSNSRQEYFLDDDVSGSLDTGLSLYCPYTSGGFLTFFLYEGRPYYFSTFNTSGSSLSYLQVFLNPSYYRFYFPDTYYVSSYSYSGSTFFYAPLSRNSSNDSFILNSLSSLGYSFTGSISPTEIIKKYCDSDLLFNDVSGGISADVSAKPVIPGACDVFNSSKSLDSYHVDSPGNDVLDLGNLLDKTGCESIDDVVSKVYTGDLTASDVIGGLDCRPYVDVDVDTGTIAIPGDTTNSRPISLDSDLSIPSDIADTDTYEPANPPKDDTTTDKPTLPKGAYAFPLADYFPFCLPFDLYKFCNLFVAVPKTPEITLDFSTFLPFLDKENPEQYVYTFDLHSLDRLAEIIRTLELFGIVLGIGLITRRIIGW